MQAVILCGGLGTRLAALYADRPKALVPVAGRPFLDWQVDWLVRGGATSIHLAAGHRAEALQAWMKTCARLPITLSAEAKPLGTGGGLKFVEPFLMGQDFLVVNGDTLLPQLDFQSLEKAHREASNSWITIAVAPIESAGRYGTMEFDEAGLVTAFREKAQQTAGWVNGGVYVVRRELLRALPAGQPTSLETDVFPGLARGRTIRAFRSAPPLLDMGTPEGLQAMEEYWGKKMG